MLRGGHLAPACDGGGDRSISVAFDSPNMPVLRELRSTLGGRAAKLQNPHDESLPTQPNRGGTKKGLESAFSTTTAKGAMSGGPVEPGHDRIAGVRFCHDRVVLPGTLPTVCHVGGMTRCRNANHGHFRLPGIRRTATRAGSDTDRASGDRDPASRSDSLFSPRHRRLREIGAIKRVSGTYRYCLTRVRRAAIAALCRVTQAAIIP
jgi:hypothetical protein